MLFRPMVLSSFLGSCSFVTAMRVIEWSNAITIGPMLRPNVS